MASTLRRSPCTVSRYHWMTRKGQPGFFPQRGDQADQVDPQTLLGPAPHPPVAPVAHSGVGSGDRCGRCRRAQLPPPEPGATRSLPECGAWSHPLDNWVPQSAHSSTACSTRCVGSCGPGQSRGDAAGAASWLRCFAFSPGIRAEPLDLTRPSNWATRFSRLSMIACCRMIKSRCWTIRRSGCPGRRS